MVREARLEHSGNVIGGHGPVGDPARARLDLDERLEPEEAARAVSHDGDIEAMGGTVGLDGAGHRFRSDGQRGGVGGDEYPRHAELPACDTSRSSRAGVTRPWSSPSSITAGDSAQFPRQ